jgi:hypothetical protein
MIRITTWSHALKTTILLHQFQINSVGKTETENAILSSFL